MISFKQFEQSAKTHNVIPMHNVMLADLHTPVSTYLTVREPDAASFLFESGESSQKLGRFSFVGIAPVLLVRAKGTTVEVNESGKTTTFSGSVFDTLADLAGRYRQAPLHDFDGFVGGFVGYIGYDCVRHLEHLHLREPEPGDPDDALLGLFTTIIRLDHRKKLLSLVLNVIIDPTRDLREQYEHGKKKLEVLELKLRNSIVTPNSFHSNVSLVPAGDDKASFCEAVRRAKEYIVEGDIFQVVLSRKTELQFSGDPFPVYRALRVINPSPYLFYVDFGKTKLIGSSPEVLVRVQGGEVEVLPIAGTRPRGQTDEQDHQLESELLQNEKELAEHVMLVDLGRNDVGRISQYGTVRVPVFKKVERYSHVMHLVSEVHGTLREGKTSLDALKACFPAGTVSGAPKVRAMQIVEELEPARRGIYAGAVGYLGFDGTLDTCIAIRTIIAHRDTMIIQAGAGIVADSVPEREYQETMDKAQVLFDAINLATHGLNAARGSDSVGDLTDQNI